jgi:hypothetical protein
MKGRKLPSECRYFTGGKSIHQKDPENQEKTKPLAYRHLFSPGFQPPRMSHFITSQMSCAQHVG